MVTLSIFTRTVSQVVRQYLLEITGMSERGTEPEVQLGYPLAHCHCLGCLHLTVLQFRTKAEPSVSNIQEPRILQTSHSMSSSFQLLSSNRGPRSYTTLFLFLRTLESQSWKTLMIPGLSPSFYKLRTRE